LKTFILNILHVYVLYTYLILPGVDVCLLATLDIGSYIDLVTSHSQIV